MTGRRPTSLRPVGLVGLVWGTSLLVCGPSLFRAVQGRSPSRGERDALVVLGARHAGQGLLQLVAPHHLATVYVVVDGLHAASMVVLAASGPRRRRAALASATIAGIAGIAALARRPVR